MIGLSDQVVSGSLNETRFILGVAGRIAPCFGARAILSLAQPPGSRACGKWTFHTRRFAMVLLSMLIIVAAAHIGIIRSWRRSVGRFRVCWRRRASAAVFGVVAIDADTT